MTELRDNPDTRASVSLTAGRSKRLESGHPWVYSNEIQLDAAAKSLSPGTIVTVKTADGRRLGVATFNPHTLIGLRLLDRDPGRIIDAGFFAARLTRALEIRRRLYPKGDFYRLVHAEADGLPGLIVDRYGATIVCQLNTAGMAALAGPLTDALKAVVHPDTILLGNDATGRQLEQLPDAVEIAMGSLPGSVQIAENDITYLAGLSQGQKTGWFFDQRENRARVAALAGGTTVLDAYCYTGGFGLLAAARGAADVLLIDRSADALRLAGEAARLNGVESRVRVQQGDAFEALAELDVQKQRFGLVVLDPPAFARAKKDLGPATRAYRKLVRLGASVTSRGGFLFIASCSHNVPLDVFGEAVRRGLQDAGRPGRLLAIGFAGADHPVHPALPESAYLKSHLLALD